MNSKSVSEPPPATDASSAPAAVAPSLGGLGGLTPFEIPQVWRVWVLAVMLVLGPLLVITGRWHDEHYLLFPLFLALPWFGPWARRLSFSTAPFLWTGLVYELYGWLIRYRGEVHTADLFMADLRWFGVDALGGRMLLPDWLALHSAPWLDAITSASYILFLPQVFSLGIWFHFRAPKRALALGLGFALLNLGGMLVWFFWPAAPPWYIAHYGLGPADLAALPSPAGTARFDALIGYPLFHDFYSRSVNVFGAMPSLHCAYPTLTLLVSRGHDRRLDIATVLYALTVIFSSMYLQHHYALDAIFGILLGIGCFFGGSVLSKAIHRRLSVRLPADVAPPR